MTTSVMRQKLMCYIADTDEKKIRDLYILIEDEIEMKYKFKLAEEHIRILDDESEKHLTGKTKSYNLSQAKQMIMDKRKL